MTKQNYIVSDSGMFPVISLNPESELPQEVLDTYKTAIVQQGPNIFWLKDNGCFPFLSLIQKDVEEVFNSNLEGKMPYGEGTAYQLENNRCPFPIDLLKYTMKYFKDIYNEHGTEAALLLLFSKRLKEWRILPVFQTGASGGSVRYVHPTTNYENMKDGSEKLLLKRVMEDEEIRPLHERVVKEFTALQEDGFAVYGTIHSHCNFGAFHSGTDDEDEADFDGLHITIGNCNSGWSFAARWMINGSPLVFEIEEVVDMSTEDFKNSLDVDNIVIDDFHMQLMKPNWLKKFEYKVTNAFGPSSWFAHHRATPVHTEIQDEEVREFGRATNLFEGVIMLPEDCIILYNPLTKTHLALPQHIYYANSNAYSHYQVITELNSEIEKDLPETVDFDTGNSMILFNVPALSGNNAGPRTAKTRRINANKGS